MPERILTAGRFGLSIDGSPAAWLGSFHGGDAIGEVVSIVEASEPVVRKRLSGVHYSDLELTIAPEAGGDLIEWLRATLARSFVRKNGAVTAVNAEFNEVERVEFSNALISEVAFPAFDAAAKKHVVLGCRLQPESTRRIAGSGSRFAAPAAKSQKALLASNFRLTIDGLDTSRVTKVDPLVVRVTTLEHETGEVRRPTKEPARIEFPNVVVTLAASSGGTWREWHEDFVVKGNNAPDRERAGTLELLSPDLKTAVLRLTLSGLGIVSLTAPPPTGSEGLAVLRAEMYCQEIALPPK